MNTIGLAVYWVRDMKHPTKKKGNDKFFILWPELAEIIRRQPRVNPNDPQELIFPVNENVVGQKFCHAVRLLGIPDLHFHDLRGTAITRWKLEKDMPLEDIRVCISGHDSTKILEKVYDRRNAGDLKAKYSKHLRSAPAEQAMAT